MWQRYKVLTTMLMLSGFAGVTIGMLKVLSTLYAIRLGATSWQMGIISSADGFGMMLMTLPAGLMVARFGARRVYLTASIGAALVYLIAPTITSLMLLPCAFIFGGMCIPFRIVAISGAFMDQLKIFGHAKAGWYRGSQVVGMIVAGPLLGTIVLERAGIFAGYWTVAAMFAFMAFAGLVALPARKPNAEIPSLRANIRDLTGLLRNDTVFGVCSIELSSSWVQSLFTAFIILIAVKSMHLSEPAAVSVRFFEGAISVLTLFFGSSLVREVAAVQLYRSSLALIVGGLILTGAASGYWGLAAATVSLGVGLGITNIVNVRQLSVLDFNKSKLSSLQLMSSMTGGCVGGLLGGLASSCVGLQGVFYAGAVLYVLLAARWCFPVESRDVAADMTTESTALAGMVVAQAEEASGS